MQKFNFQLHTVRHLPVPVARKRMVRVISAHHFAAQDVATCPAVECSTVAEHDLLLATDLHEVEVRDLTSSGGQLSHVLHTVDLVVEMVYSPVGTRELNRRYAETTCKFFYLLAVISNQCCGAGIFCWSWSR